MTPINKCAISNKSAVSHRDGWYQNVKENTDNLKYKYKSYQNVHTNTNNIEIQIHTISKCS